MKRVRAAIDKKDKKAAELLQVAVRAIDKAAQKGVIKRETAARKIGRLTRAVNRLPAAAAPASK